MPKERWLPSVWQEFILCHGSIVWHRIVIHWIFSFFTGEINLVFWSKNRWNESTLSGKTISSTWTSNNRYEKFSFIYHAENISKFIFNKDLLYARLCLSPLSNFDIKTTFWNVDFRLLYNSMCCKKKQMLKRNSKCTQRYIPIMNWNRSVSWS